MKYPLVLAFILCAGSAYAQDSNVALTKQLQQQQDNIQRDNYLQKREQTRLLQQQQQEQNQQSQMQRQQQNLDAMHYSTDANRR